MKNTWLRKTAGASALFVLLVASAASAQSDAPEPSQWKSIAGFYGGYHTVESTDQTGDFQYDVDTRSGDLEWIFGLYMMAWKNRWGANIESSWVTEEYDDVLYDDGTNQLGGTLDATLFDVEGFAFFSLLGAEKERPLDVLAGARYFFSRNQVRLASNQTQFVGAIDTTGTLSHSWIDPTIGLRFTTTRTAKFWALVRADVGGFSVGSDLSWQIRLMGSIRITPTFDLGVALKVTDVDYDNGESGADYYATNATHGNFLFTALFRID